MQKSAKPLAFAGLIPFLALNILSVIDVIPHHVVNIYFTQYSAVLLSFFGGIHWYDAISNQKNSKQLYIAMLPTLIGWVCLTQSGSAWVLSVLSISYILLMIFDNQLLTLPKPIVIEYTKMRMRLTTIVVLSHAFMMYQY